MVEPRQFLEGIGAFADDSLPLFATALNIAALNHVGRRLEPYENHLRKMQEQVGVRYADLLAAGAEENAATKIASIKHILCDQYQYHGAVSNFNDMRNADIMEVVDARQGLPIALSILALECAWAQGWDVKGINFPGHFLIRFDDGGQRVLSNPFHQFRLMQAPDLRQLLKTLLGANAELTTAHYQEISRREIILRLQNNIKFRQIEGEFYDEALATVTVMRLVAPDEFRLLLDDGVLKARLGRPLEAIESVRSYLQAVTNPRDRYDAEVLLRTLELQI